MTSRELIALDPGARIVDLDGKDYVLIGRTIVDEGEPGPGRVRLEAIPLDALDGKAREWVTARGWHKTSFYFRARTVRGDHVTAAEPGKFAR